MRISDWSSDVCSSDLPGQEKLLLVDFLSENSTYMPIRIQTYGSFFKDRRANVAMVSGVVIGIAVLIFLNFLFFSITGHREFIWLGVAQGFFALNTVLAEGYIRSEEHTSELQSLMRISYAVFCLKKKTK